METKFPTLLNNKQETCQVQKPDPLVENQDEVVEKQEKIDDNKLYYWEDGRELPALTKLSHVSYWMAYKVLEGLEFTGEVVATFLGLTKSRYQWVLDVQAREEENQHLKELEKSQRRQLKLKEMLEKEKKILNELENGKNETKNDVDP